MRDREKRVKDQRQKIKESKGWALGENHSRSPPRQNFLSSSNHLVNLRKKTNNTKRDIRNSLFRYTIECTFTTLLPLRSERSRQKRNSSSRTALSFHFMCSLRLYFLSSFPWRRFISYTSRLLLTIFLFFSLDSPRNHREPTFDEDNNLSFLFSQHAIPPTGLSLSLGESFSLSLIPCCHSFTQFCLFSICYPNNDRNRSSQKWNGNGMGSILTAWE